MYILCMYMVKPVVQLVFWAYRDADAELREYVVAMYSVCTCIYTVCTHICHIFTWFNQLSQQPFFGGI